MRMEQLVWKSLNSRLLDASFPILSASLEGRGLSAYVMIDESMVGCKLPSEAISPESKYRSYYADLSITP